MLKQLNSREEREQLLNRLLKDLGDKNPTLSSELATLLALLVAEKADTENATSYLMHAYNNNKYNSLAFEKLSELIAEQIEVPIYLAHLRRLLVKNPLDIDTAVAFAQYCLQLELYETSAGSYQYCADLFSYLYPGQPLPASIYLPWAISNYNTVRYQYKAIRIAEQVRQSGRLDLLLETIAANAAAKTGQNQLSQQLLKNAEQKALRAVAFESSFQGVTALGMGWFYCFGMAEPVKGLDWANKAYSSDPNSETTAALLAYALVINGQTDWARPLIENYQQNQVAALALAKIQLKEKQRAKALETLKSAISLDPTSVEAEYARKILAQNQSSYIPAIDPGVTLTVLKNNFDQAIIPAFVEPGNLISFNINLRGSKFSYDSSFGGYITVTNNSSQPLIIADDGLFSGNIRVDVDISGDINRKIANLITLKTKPSAPTEPGQTLLIPLKLETGQLRQILSNHPQASLDIKFTAYLDPVTTDQDIVANRLSDIEPATITVQRSAIRLTAKYLQNRFNSLSKGRQGQRNKTARLFIGLLAEQQLMAHKDPLYKFIYADWMPTMLKSALVQSLTDNDWVITTHTIADMLEMPLDYELVSAASENLHAPHWPVRLISLYLLAKTHDSNFQKVLNWSAKHDPNKLVRDMAIALGATIRQQQPPTEPAVENNQRRQGTGRISTP